MEFRHRQVIAYLNSNSKCHLLMRLNLLWFWHLSFYLQSGSQLTASQNCFAEFLSIWLSCRLLNNTVCRFSSKDIELNAVNTSRMSSFIWQSNTNKSPPDWRTLGTLSGSNEVINGLFIKSGGFFPHVGTVWMYTRCDPPLLWICVCSVKPPTHGGEIMGSSHLDSPSKRL